MPEVHSRLPDNSTRGPIARHEWFLVFDHERQGPLAADELIERISAGAVPRQALVWREGFADWMPVTETQEFKAYAASMPDVPSKDIGGLDWQLPMHLQQDFIDTPSQTKPRTTQIGAENAENAEASANTEDSLSELEIPSWTDFKKRQLGAYLDQPPHQRPTFSLVTSERSSSLRNWIVAAAVFLASAVTVVAYSWRHSIHHAADLTDDENRRLATVAASPLSAQGPKAAVALSHADAFAPVFVIATNLPDGTRLNIQIDGVSETLLGRLRVSVRTSVIVDRALARTPVFRQEGGGLYPQGKYAVKVSCASCSVGEAPENLADEAFFVGGSPDAAYEAKLREYHERLRAQARDELNELKQFTDTLINQLSDSVSQFEIARTAREPAVSDKSWARFHEQWSEMQSQIDAVFARWTPEALDSAYYYASDFTRLKQAGEAVRTLHQAQNQALSSNADPTTLTSTKIASKIANDAAAARALLNSIREKIQTTQTLAPSPNGMPPRHAL